MAPIHFISLCTSSLLQAFAFLLSTCQHIQLFCLHLCINRERQQENQKIYLYWNTQRMVPCNVLRNVRQTKNRLNGKAVEKETVLHVNKARRFRLRKQITLDDIGPQRQETYHVKQNT